MSEVKRYDIYKYTSDIVEQPNSQGVFIRYSDYEKLKAQLEKAEKALRSIDVDDSSIQGKWVSEYELRDVARQYFKEKEQV